MIYMNNLIKKCKENGIEISKMGLYVAGTKNGFIVKKQDELQLDQDKFLSWIDKVNEKAPEGWKNIKELAEELSVSYAKLYQVINEEKIEQKRIGMKGVIYVQSDRIKETLQKRSHEYEW